MKRFCPYCEESLEIIDVDFEGFDIWGCQCDYDELSIKDFESELEEFRKIYL